MSFSVGLPRTGRQMRANQSEQCHDTTVMKPYPRNDRVLLIIGGLEEKTLGAKRAGIEHISTPPRTTPT